MPRFALLFHETPADFGRPSHYDLLLEDAGVLLTWELTDLPVANVPQDCRRLADHRLHYLDYEGPISNNRGHVQRVDAGEIVWLEQGAKWAVEIRGERLLGRMQLTATPAGIETAVDPTWRLTYIPHRS